MAQAYRRRKRHATRDIRCGQDLAHKDFADRAFDLRHRRFARLSKRIRLRRRIRALGLLRNDGRIEVLLAFPKCRFHYRSIEFAKGAQNHRACASSPPATTITSTRSTTLRATKSSPHFGIPQAHTSAPSHSPTTNSLSNPMPHVANRTRRSRKRRYISLLRLGLYVQTRANWAALPYPIDRHYTKR